MSFNETIESEGINKITDLMDRVSYLESIPVTIGAGLNLNIRSVSGVDTIDSADFAIIADATGGAFAENLPAAATVSGQLFYIKKIDATANAVTVTASGAETIDGIGTYALSAQYDAVLIISDGSNWHIIATV